MVRRKSEHQPGDAEHVDRVLHESVSSEYAALADWQRRLQSAVRDLGIKRIEAAFNEALAAMPQATLAEKSALCRWANAELRSMGLAIRCPKTGEPAMIHADPGHHPQIGRFQVEVFGSRQKTRSTPTLFPLELCDNPRARTDPLADYWSDRLAGEKKPRRDRS